MKTYYQVVCRESGKLKVIKDKITNYWVAENIMNNFLLTLPFIDGEYSDVQIYTINEEFKEEVE